MCLKEHTSGDKAMPSDTPGSCCKNKLDGGRESGCRESDGQPSCTQRWRVATITALVRYKVIYVRKRTTVTNNNLTMLWNAVEAVSNYLTTGDEDATQNKDA